MSNSTIEHSYDSIVNLFSMFCTMDSLLHNLNGIIMYIVQ